jgi:hypothetical protein
LKVIISEKIKNPTGHECRDTLDVCIKAAIKKNNMPIKNYEEDGKSFYNGI